jgi:uncharacterized membrane protein YcaP (DUF421 family)
MQPFDWHAMWAPTWHPATVAVRAAMIYLLVQAMFRVIGRKELARYSTFDIAVLFLITVAARQSIVGDDKSITSAAIGLGTILGLDWFLSYLCFRSSTAARIIQGPVPRLVHDGIVDEHALRRHRMSREQLQAFLRQHGHHDIGDVADAYLERNGSVSFVFRDQTLH